MMKDKKEKIMLPLWLVLATVAVIATICFETLGNTSFRDTGIIIGTIASCAALSCLSEIWKFPKNQMIRRFGRNYCLPVIAIIDAYALISVYCDDITQKIWAVPASAAIIILPFRGAIQSMNSVFPRWKQKVPELLDAENERSFSVLLLTSGIYVVLGAVFLIGIGLMYTTLTNITNPIILGLLLFPPVLVLFALIAYTEKLEQRRKARLKSFSPTDRMERIHSAAKQYIGYIDNALYDKNIRNIAITGDFGIGKSSLIKTYEKKKHRKFIHLSVSDLAEIKDGETPHDLTKADIEKNLLKRLLSICREKDIPMSHFQTVPEAIIRIRKITWFCAFFVLDLMFIFLEPFIRDINFIPDDWDSLQMLTNYVNADSVLHLAKVLFFPIVFLFVLKTVDVIIKHYNLPKINTKLIKGNSETTAEFNPRIEPEDLDTNYMEIVYVLEQVAKKGDRVFVFEDMDRFDASVCVPILVKLRQFNEILNDRSSLKKRWFKGQKYTFIYVLRESIFEEYCNSSNLSDSFLNTSADLYKFCDIIIPVVPEIGTHNSATYLEEVLRDYGSFNADFLSAIAPHLVDYRRINDVTNEYKIFASVYRDELRTEKERTELLACVLFKVFYPSEYYQLRKDGTYSDPAEELHKVLKAEYEGGVRYFSNEQCVRFIGGSNKEIEKWKLKTVLDQIQDIMRKIDNKKAQRIWSEFYSKEKPFPVSSFADTAKKLTEIDNQLTDHSSIIQCFELLIKEHVDVKIAESYAGILVKEQQPTVVQVESVEQFVKRYDSRNLVAYYMQIAGKLIVHRTKSIREKGNIVYRGDNRATLRTMQGVFVKSLQKTTAVQSFARAIWSVVQYETEERQWKYIDMFRDDILTHYKDSVLIGKTLKTMYGGCLFFIWKNQESILLQLYMESVSGSFTYKEMERGLDILKKMKIIRRISSDWSIISLTDKEKEEYRDVLKTLIKADPTSKNPLKRLADSVKNMGVDAELREEITKEIERIEGEIGKSKNEQTDVEGTS